MEYKYGERELELLSKVDELQKEKKCFNRAFIRK